MGDALAAWAAAGAVACSARGLSRSAAWLAELSLAAGAAPADLSRQEPLAGDEAERPTPLYVRVKSLFEAGEYARAARLAESETTSPRLRFLHLYALYLAAETRRLSDAAPAQRDAGAAGGGGGGAGSSGGGGAAPDATSCGRLRALHERLKREYALHRLDGYGLYLYGVVLKRLELGARATRVLEEAVDAAPWLWAAWLELASLPRDRDALRSLRVPAERHPIVAELFLGRARLETKSPEEALETYEALRARHGLADFAYLNAQVAVARHDAREVDDAVAAFELVRRADPLRLDDLDVYSHLLYVKEMRTELANLAHEAVEIDKYRVETCCIVGNYYSLRREHQKAVVYFQRALKLNPNYLSAWILMGHEFIELQNTNAAIQSYRRAVEVNRNDYRAWNGLGQAYEILGLNGYCLYYYSRAAQQCPNDSRMLVALGEAFEKLDKIPNALKCYHRAHSVGDIEGMAILKLAKLYDKLGMRDSAAAAYSAACVEGEADAEKGLQEAHRYLAHYHLIDGRLDHAAHYAYKCMEHEETKEEGKSLLKIVSERRADANKGSVAAESDLDTTGIAGEAASPKPPDSSGLGPSPSRYRI